MVLSKYFCSLQYKTDRDDIAEILLKVALNTIILTPSWILSMKLQRRKIKIKTTNVMSMELEKKFLTVIVNNSTKINKAIQRL
jgi:hypothetical protein